MTAAEADAIVAALGLTERARELVESAPPISDELRARLELILANPAGLPPVDRRKAS